MLDKNINKFNGLQSFFVEFFAYSITNIGIVKKIYIKPVFNEKKIQDQKIILDNKKLNLLSQVLKSNILSSFFSDRYSLYDISFRKSKSSSSIGFSFNDIKDSSYIEPIKIFQIFECFETDSVVNITKRIQKSIFKQQPQYNPIFMIGFVAENTVMTCIKAYVRFDTSEVQTRLERWSVVNNFIKAIELDEKVLNNTLFELLYKLEDIGFVFCFFGVDSYASGFKRFKLYFRLFEKRDTDMIMENIKLLLFQFGFYYNDSLKKIFKKHKHGIWGLAIAIDTFGCINGIQLYFYS